MTSRVRDLSDVEADLEAHRAAKEAKAAKRAEQLRTYHEWLARTPQPVHAHGVRIAADAWRS